VAEDPGFELARRYRDGCPSSSTASLAALGAMSNAELTGFVESNMEEALNADSPLAITSTGVGSGDTGTSTGQAAAPSTGGVSVSW
jgi:hypothetical protein